MRRGLFATVLWTCVAACIGVGLFFIKHEVKDQERRLTALNAQIQGNQETIHILRAEWSYLNDPTRLRGLAEKHLGMHPVKASEVASLESVLRDGLPGTMLAAATPPRIPPPPTIKPGEPVLRQPVKLADGPSKARPSEAVKPAPKPQPSKPGSVTMAKTETPAPTAASPPAVAGRAIIIKSPSLAQQDDGGGR